MNQNNFKHYENIYVIKSKDKKIKLINKIINLYLYL